MATAPPVITALPTPPDPNDRATFNTRAYPWSVAQQTLANEANAVAANVYANAQDAAAQAALATTKASEALNSANNAATSKTGADSARDAAALSAASALDSKNTASDKAAEALASLNDLKGRYYGAFAAAPTLRPDGTARQAGDLYFNTTGNVIYAFNAGVWSLVPGATAADLAAPTGTALVGDGPDTLETVLRKFTAPNNSNFAFMGDSISTVGVVGGGMDWPAQWLQKSFAVGRGTAYRYAVSGYRMFQVLDDYPTTAHTVSPAITGKPGYFFCLVGANDITLGGINTGAYMFEQLQNIWAAAKGDGFKVIAFTVFARTNSWLTDNGTSELNRQSLNALIRAAQGTGQFDYLVDTAALLPDPYDLNFFQSDKIHPNAAGMTVIASAVNTTMATGWSHTPASQLTSVSAKGNFRTNYTALTNLTTGENDTSIGYSALANLTTGSNNTAIGKGAAKGAVTASRMVAIGSGACDLVTGNDNIGIGYFANGNSTGADNVATGNQSLLRNTTGIKNVVYGNFAGFNAGGNNNTAVGHTALQIPGGASVAVSDNTAIGYQALGIGALTTGGNTAVGSNSGQLLTSGNHLTAVGYVAASASTTGSDNTAVGYGALASSSGARNTVIGSQAELSPTTGNDRVSIGFNANADSGDTGAGGVAIGSGAHTGTGINAVAIGMGANTTVNNAVQLGNGTNSSDSTVQYLSATIADSRGPAGTVITLRTNATPTASAANRGQLNYVEGGPGVKDTVQICAKDASDVWAWRTIY